MRASPAISLHASSLDDDARSYVEMAKRVTFDVRLEHDRPDDSADHRSSIAETSPVSGSDGRPVLLHALDFEVAHRLLDAPGNRGIPLLVSDLGGGLDRLSWSSDGRSRLRRVLSRAAGLALQCSRDVDKARELGFRGQCLGPAPLPVQTDLGHLVRLYGTGFPKRRILCVDGRVQAGTRPLHALAAIHMAADALADWEVVVIGGDMAVRETVRRIAGLRRFAIRWVDLPRTDLQRAEIIAASRVFVSLDVTTATSSWLPFALAFGARTIQSAAGATHSLFGLVPEPVWFASPHDVRALAGLVREATEAPVSPWPVEHQARLANLWRASCSGQLLNSHYDSVLAL